MDDADNYTLVVCPPSAPPPSPPPDFGTWSQLVPWWFWLMFTFTCLFAAGGPVARVHDPRHPRDAARHGGDGRRPGRGTAHALTQLEAQVAHMCTGL